MCVCGGVSGLSEREEKTDQSGWEKGVLEQLCKRTDCLTCRKKVYPPKNISGSTVSHSAKATHSPVVAVEPLLYEIFFSPTLKL